MRWFPYQTAYLKYYYPVEFMAALMTSVIDNPGKVAEYIWLPPDGHQNPAAGYQQRGGGNFRWTMAGIRYGLAAIKSIGKPVIDDIMLSGSETGCSESPGFCGAYVRKGS